MNERLGSNRRAPSTITTPDGIAPLESARQVRALRGPKRLMTAASSSVRDAYALPVQTTVRKRKPRKGAPYNPRHHDEPGRFTLAIGGSMSPRYVPGNG